LPDTDDRVISITIKGHAISGTMFRDDADKKKVPAAKGENILCAAVSFSGLNLVRSLTIMAGVTPDYSIGNGFMRLSLATGSLDKASISIVSVLLESFIIGMLDLERKYREYITVRINQNTSKCK
jgi:uncharacterized protein YsxB (DUF464 family)